MALTLHHLNARNLLCPLPVIRVQDKVKTLQTGDKLEVTCTDPGVLYDIPAWCRMQGHKILETRQEEHEIVLLLEVVKNV